MNNEIDKIDVIDKIIRKTKFPLLMLLNILKNNVSDENKLIVIKSFFIHHIIICIECNLLQIEYIEKNLLLYNFISDIYYILSKQLLILPHLKKLYNANNNHFKKLDIDNMIIYLKNQKIKFLSLFDGSIGTFYFHVKLKGLNEGNEYHIDEMISRLKQTVSMFKITFFNEYNIILLSYDQFVDLIFKNKLKYVEYIFSKINSIINNNINYLILYNNYRNQLYNLLYNKSNINIDINDVSSDIEGDELPFIISKT